MRLLVTVGTARGGFDALIAAADRAAATLGLAGLAQIGHGHREPRHLPWVRFLEPERLRALLARRPLVVTHAGMGTVGEAMRAGCRILLVPRPQRTSRRHPSNDQRAFARRLAALHPVHLCPHPGELEAHLRRLRDAPAAPVPYRLESDVPLLLRDFLARLP